MNKPVIDLKKIYKIYKMGDTVVEAGADINLEIYEGEFVVIMGASGSGKSTVMNIIGCLDRPTTGTYLLDGKEVSSLADDELASIRNKKIGFIFQKFHLLSGSTAMENVELPMIYSGREKEKRYSTSMNSLDIVGLAGRESHRPNELSGGQMQRVAIARSLVNNPSLILADEPTGNLDSKSGYEIMSLFQRLHREGKTIVLITHNPEMIKYGTRVIKLHDGRIVSDEKTVEKVDFISQKDCENSTREKTLERNTMNLFQSFRLAWNALQANKMRSLLTMLGIIIGVCAVIVMTSIGEGTRHNIMKEISSLGSNLIFVEEGYSDSVINKSVESSKRKITLKDVKFIKDKCSLITGIAPQLYHSVIARYNSSNLSANIVGTNNDYLYVRNFPVKSGRLFTEQELKNRAKVCLLGAEVAEKLLGKEENPLGKIIKVSSDWGSEIRLTVIGVLKKKGKSFGENNDKLIIVPFNTVKYRIYNSKYVHLLFLKAKDGGSVEEAVKQVKKVLAPLHDNDPANLQIESQQQIVKAVEKSMKAFTFMLGGIAFVSLLVGGIGIMNIMLVSVTERTKEIGLRKAIGARKEDILLQFLVEALVLSLTGGFIGIAAGVGLSKLYTIITAAGSLKMLSQTFISLYSIGLSFSFSAVIGIFFGIYPARKAASLDPIDALRYE